VQWNHCHRAAGVVIAQDPAVAYVAQGSCKLTAVVHTTVTFKPSGSAQACSWTCSALTNQPCCMLLRVTYHTVPSSLNDVYKQWLNVVNIMAEGRRTNGLPHQFLAILQGLL